MHRLISRSSSRSARNSKPAPAAILRGIPASITGSSLLLSPNFPEVLALYENAGLNLLADLNTLNATQRIAADPAAVQYLSQNIIYNGKIHIPVLTMHTVGDGLVINENESAYAKVVAEEGNSRFLRQTFVNRAGHCAFTPAETVTAVGTLLNRLRDRQMGADHSQPFSMRKRQRSDRSSTSSTRPRES